MTTFITSDTHFGHRKGILLMNRPFMKEENGEMVPDTHAMDETMIQNWNSVVGPRDTVIHLGDVSWHKDPEHNKRIFQRLNGKVELVLGNHDHSFPRRELYDNLKEISFERIDLARNIRVNKRKVICFHYPIEDWDGRYRGSFHFHGHIHSTPDKTSILPMARRYDVGVDRNALTPIPLELLIARLENDIADGSGTGESGARALPDQGTLV
jgi:calcineurin-like phosphoesterase family protein